MAVEAESPTSVAVEVEKPSTQWKASPYEAAVAMLSSDGQAAVDSFEPLNPPSALPRVGDGPADVPRSKDSAVRVSAVSAMTTVEGQDVQDRLTRLAAEDPTGRVRRTARKALRSRARD